MNATKTQQMIDAGLPTNRDVLAAMAQYKVDFAGSCSPAWIAEWFRAAWHTLRSRGFSVAELSAELEAA